jgi:hypothetical protein
MKHIVLLGDSVFDNGAYVAGGLDVIQHLRDRIPSDWRADLLAVDGSLIANVLRQLERLPSEATHLVISVGGNDALGYSTILGARSESIGESLAALSEIADLFQREYEAMVKTVLEFGLPTALCTIYDVRYPDKRERRIALAALAIINDRITRGAVGQGLPVLDLRLVCNDDADFANPIEPSVQGGWKIAGAITSLVSEHDFSMGRCQIFT